MSRHSFASSNSRLRSASSERSGPRNRQLEISVTLERRWFEFDRNVVTGVLANLQRSIHYGATQVEMISAEQMFDEVLSRELSRTARYLDRMVARLRQLTTEVNGATGYPKSESRRETVVTK